MSLQLRGENQPGVTELAPAASARTPVPDHFYHQKDASPEPHFCLHQLPDASVSGYESSALFGANPRAVGPARHATALKRLETPEAECREVPVQFGCAQLVALRNASS